MDYSILEKCTLFAGMPAKRIREMLEETPHHIQCYDKGETIFHLMNDADRIGIVLEGTVQVQKSFPNGSQVNVSVRLPGELIGPAAVLSRSRKYPCDVVSLEPSTIMMFCRGDLLRLMQKDLLILENLTTEIASAAYMLQQRLELLSYSGIGEKAAFYLLTKAREIKTNRVPIPGSVSKWAMAMNVSRPSLHRELKKLETEKIISYRPPLVEILDSGRLEAVLNR